MLSVRETPMYFEAGQERLFGLLSEGKGDRPVPRGVVVSLSSGGTPLSTSVNDIWVRLSRGSAERGLAAFRFDYHGVGESTGELDRFDLAEPFTKDLLGAIHHLETLGLDEVLLIGSCFGARTALSAAPAVEHLAGLVLLCPPVRDFEMGQRVSTRMAELPVNQLLWRAAKPRVIRGFLSPNRRTTYRKIFASKMDRLQHSKQESVAHGVGPVSNSFLGSLKWLAERGVPTLIVYGEQDDLFDDYLRAQPLFESSLSLPSARVELRRVGGSIHGFGTMESQDTVLELVRDWVGRLNWDGA